MIENRKWFKGSRDRVINTIHVRFINSDNEENLKKFKLLKLIRNEDNLIAS